MNIGVIKENLDIEKRISITPEIVRKFSKIGFTVNIEKEIGAHLGIKDEDFISCGAKIENEEKKPKTNSNYDYVSCHWYMR